MARNALIALRFVALLALAHRNFAAPHVGRARVPSQAAAPRARRRRDRHRARLQPRQEGRGPIIELGKATPPPPGARGRGRGRDKARGGRAAGGGRGGRGDGGGRGGRGDGGGAAAARARGASGCGRCARRCARARGRRRSRCSRARGGASTSTARRCRRRRRSATGAARAASSRTCRPRAATRPTRRRRRTRSARATARSGRRRCSSSSSRSRRPASRRSSARTTWGSPPPDASATGAPRSSCCRSMGLNDVPPSVVSYNAALSALGRGGRWQQALELLERWIESAASRPTVRAAAQFAAQFRRAILPRAAAAQFWRNSLTTPVHRLHSHLVLDDDHRVPEGRRVGGGGRGCSRRCNKCKPKTREAGGRRDHRRARRPLQAAARRTQRVQLHRGDVGPLR